LTVYELSLWQLTKNQRKGVAIMSIETHIDSLAKKREELKTQIAEEAARPSPDFVLITNWKKENLALKEEMQHYFSMIEETVAS
jgi:hypothetical protein